MKTLSKYSVLLVIVYLAAWTASYVAMFFSRGDGWDFSHFCEYFALAWTFRGGEIPTFIWWFSVFAFFPLAGLAIFLLKKYERHRRAVA